MRQQAANAVTTPSAAFSLAIMRAVTNFWELE